MRIYKFKDEVDGQFAFIVAKNKGDAIKTLQGLTSVPFIYVGSRSPEDLNRPIILMNNILPF